MRNYDVIIIVHPELDETALTGVVDRVKGWIADAGGQTAKVDTWGKRRMAYSIRKQREGQYVVLNAEMEPASTAALERNIRLLEPVMRYMITAIE